MIYKLLREPSALDDIIVDWKKQDCSISIWRDNGTFMCVGGGSGRVFRERYVSFLMIPLFDKGSIYGKTDAAIAETATFFWSLPFKMNSKEDLSLFIITENDYFYGNEGLQFDFAVLQAEQLAQAMDSNPARRLEIRTGTWNAEQSSVLATRPYPIYFTIGNNHHQFGERKDFSFQDDGTAFLDALEKRQSSFGSINLTTMGSAFSSANLRRLLHLEYKLDKLAMSSLYGEDILLPFSAKVNVLSYKNVKAVYMEQYVKPIDLDSLTIVANDVNVTINLDLVTDWTWLLSSFLNRVAMLGQLRRFRIAAFWDEYFPEDSDASDDTSDDSDEEPCDPELQLDVDDVVPVAEALTRVIVGNPNLTHLTLGNDGNGFLDWSPHIKGIFRALEGHACIRTLVLEGNAPTINIYPWMARLLKRNRFITVLDCSGDKISNGSRINRLNSLNHFYRGSASLLNESSSLRRQLVTSALMQDAARNVPQIALLLSDHADILCEYLISVNLDEVALMQETPTTVPSDALLDHTDSRKRRR